MDSKGIWTIAWGIVLGAFLLFVVIPGVACTSCLTCAAGSVALEADRERAAPCQAHGIERCGVCN